MHVCSRVLQATRGQSHKAEKQSFDDVVKLKSSIFYQSKQIPCPGIFGSGQTPGKLPSSSNSLYFLLTNDAGKNEELFLGVLFQSVLKKAACPFCARMTESITVPH